MATDMDVTPRANTYNVVYLAPVSTITSPPAYRVTYVATFAELNAVYRVL